MKVTVIKDSVIYQQTIYRKDETIEISDEATVESLMERGYIAVDVPQWQEIAPELDEAGVVGIPYSKEELAEFDRKELQEIAKNLGVKANGTNEEIIERIVEFHAVEETADDEDESGEDELPNTSMPE